VESSKWDHWIRRSSQQSYLIPWYNTTAITSLQPIAFDWRMLLFMIPFQSTTSTHSSSSPPNLLKVSILQNFLFRLLINELRRNQGIIINRPSLCCISVKYSLSTIQITFPTNQSTTKIFTRTFFSSIHSQFLSFIHLSITTTSSHLISSNHSTDFT
jgi:hypothetical protein